MFLLPLRDINPSRRAPIVTIAIVVISFAFFFWELSILSSQGKAGLEAFIASRAFVPKRFWMLIMSWSISGWLTALKMILWSTFLHGGWAHIIGNMWFLYVFGDNVEDTMGHANFALFYLLSSVAGMLLHAIVFPGSTTPLIGGSAAISGVLGAYMVLFPGAPIETLLIIFVFPVVIYISAYWYLFYWFILQVVSGLVDVFSPVAYWAHVGGFLFGLYVGYEVKRHFSPKLWDKWMYYNY
jgi:membrane associated rhomboid family serine protease